MSKICGIAAADIIIDTRIVKGFVFCCSFVNRQTITSIRTTMYYSILRAMKEDMWLELEMKAFGEAYLAAVKQLKVSKQFVPSTKEIDPALDIDLLTIVRAIPDCLSIKRVVTAVLSLSLTTGARSISLSNVQPGDILQCIPVRKQFK